MTKRDQASQYYINELFRMLEVRGLGKWFIEVNGGPTQATLRNWETGKTRCPQLVSIRFAFRALGYDLEIVPHRQHNSLDVKKKWP